MRASVTLLLALAACGGHPTDTAPPEHGATLDLRDTTAAAALIELGRGVHETVSIDSDANALATCARVTLVTPGPRPASELVTLLGDALRPAGLRLSRLPSGIVMHRIPGAPPPPGCAVALAPPPPPLYPPRAVPSPDDAAIVAGIHDEGNGHYRLTAGAAGQMGSSQDFLMRAARVVPEIRNGEPVGMRVFGLHQGTVMSALGFQNGDTITNVNGHPLRNPDEALEAYAQMRGRSDTTVDVERAGQTVTLSYHVDPP